MERLICLLLLFTIATAREYTDEEISNFPKLFHLDDYERCLAKRDGLSCLGVFDLSPNDQPNPLYDLLKEYSDESYRHFNRTRIHRGYCVSSRCPNDIENATDRFERCVDKYARGRSLRATINTVHYCHTHTERHTEQPSTPEQNIYLQCVYAIVLINIIGTIYDVYTGDSPDKNKLISAFSIPANWRRLMVINESEDAQISALKPLNGIRGVAMLFTTFAHSSVLHFNAYTLNPEALEEQTQRIDSNYLADGTSVIQALVMMSCFLTCYNLLIFSKKRPLKLSMLPMFIIKRIIRITPVYLLMIGFASTWWLHLRQGPLVPFTIGLDSRPCQTKFWSHIFFINNMVDRTNYCLMPTWYMPVDMHMYIIACMLTLTMWRHRCKALKLYMILLVAASVLIGVVAYMNNYKSMVYLTTPEALRKVYRDSPSFTNYYISSWGAIPSCLLGLILAHVQFEIDEKTIKISQYKWFVYLHYVTVPSIFTWALTGVFARRYSSPLFHAVHMAFDKPIYCIIMSLCLLGLIHVDGPLTRFFSWNGWIITSRLSLTVMLLHWVVNLTIVTRSVAFSTSLLDVIVDWTATNVITYVLAIPITAMVEIPMQKFMGLLMF